MKKKDVRGLGSGGGGVLLVRIIIIIITVRISVLCSLRYFSREIVGDGTLCNVHIYNARYQRYIRRYLSTINRLLCWLRECMQISELIIITSTSTDSKISLDRLYFYEQYQAIS